MSRSIFKANLELAQMGVLKPIRLEGWIRAIVPDVELTFKMVPEIRHLNLSISTSDQMINGKFKGKMTKERCHQGNDGRCRCRQKTRL